MVLKSNAKLAVFSPQPAIMKRLGLLMAMVTATRQKTILSLMRKFLLENILTDLNKLITMALSVIQK